MKIYTRFLLLPSIILVTTAFANSLSKSCSGEVIGLFKDYDLNIQAAIEDLVPVAVKVKAQAKAPLQFLFGPGPDNKMTDIGISVGCLKQFPESANAITSMLKSLGLEATKGTVASKLNATKKGTSNVKFVNQNSQRNEAAETKKLKSKMLYIC